MKVIDLKHKDKKLAMEAMKKHPGCGMGSVNGVWKIMCDGIHKVEEVKVVKKVDKKKVREDIVDEIDTNGNGRLTKKEIKSWINKKDDDK